MEDMEELSRGEVVAFILAIVGIILLWIKIVPKFWSGQYRYDPTILDPFRLLFTLTARRGFHRAMLAGLVTFTMSVAGGLVVVIYDVYEPLHDYPVIIYIALMFVIVGLALFFVLGFSITMYNRPRFIVPPSMRNQPGVAALRRRLRRIRRAAREKAKGEN